MREVRVAAADGLDPEAAVVIRIVQPMRDMPYERSAAFFASEGSALAEAIWSSCPRGTVDALIAALLAKRASMFRISFGPTKESRND